MAAATSRSSSSLGGGGLQVGQGLGPGAVQGEELGGASPQPQAYPLLETSWGQRTLHQPALTGQQRGMQMQQDS